MSGFLHDPSCVFLCLPNKNIKQERMALPKKKSRIIEIDTISYRWMVGPNDMYNVFVAEKESIKGSRIEVYFHPSINKSLGEYPDPDKRNLKIITPKNAALIIRQALQMGWDPEKKSAPIVYDLNEDKMIKREHQDHIDPGTNKYPKNNNVT